MDKCLSDRTLLQYVQYNESLLTHYIQYTVLHCTVRYSKYVQYVPDYQCSCTVQCSVQYVTALYSIVFLQYIVYLIARVGFPWHSKTLFSKNKLTQGYPRYSFFHSYKILFLLSCFYHFIVKLMTEDMRLFVWITIIAATVDTTYCTQCTVQYSTVRFFCSVRHDPFAKRWCTYTRTDWTKLVIKNW